MFAGRANHYFTGMDADAHAPTSTRSAFFARALLHRDSRQAGAQRMVFLRHGSAEQGQQTIAEQLADGATVGLDGVCHRSQRMIEKGLRVLGVGPVHECRRIAQVGKQDGDMLSFVHHRQGSRGPGHAARRRIATKRRARLTCGVAMYCVIEARATARAIRMPQPPSLAANRTPHHRLPRMYRTGLHPNNARDGATNGPSPQRRGHRRSSVFAPVQGPHQHL